MHRKAAFANTTAVYLSVHEDWICENNTAVRQYSAFSDGGIAMLEIGDQAPDFDLEGDDGKRHSLAEFAGRKVVLYFYPQDNSHGCTTEAREFSELAEHFLEKKAVIVGISPNSIESHKKFKKNIGINFLLLSDPDKVVAAAYNALDGDRLMRSTFAISGGVIRHLWRKVNPAGHANAVLLELTF
jgi:peroxiredoxin Q/BCP